MHQVGFYYIDISRCTSTKHKNYIRLSFLPEAVRLFRGALTVLPVVSSREVSITQTAVGIKYTLLNMKVSFTDFKKLSYVRIR